MSSATAALVATLVPLAACSSDDRIGTRSTLTDSPESAVADNRASQPAGGSAPVAPLAGDRCVPVVTCHSHQRSCELVRVVDGTTVLADDSWELIAAIPGRPEVEPDVDMPFEVIETQRRCRRRPRLARPPVGCALVGGACQIQAGMRAIAGECTHTIGTASLTVARSWAGKPPLEEHFLNLEIRNTAADPRWYLIGYQVDEDWQAMAGSVTVRKLEGQGGELYVFGDGDGFAAVRVAAGATLRLEELPSQSFSPIPDRLSLRISTARELRVKGVGIEELLGRKLTAGRGTAHANYRDLKPTGVKDVVDAPRVPYLAHTDLGAPDSHGFIEPVAIELPGLCYQVARPKSP